MATPETKTEKSFWTTLPGILTGIAAIITAIGGLVLALNTVGILTPQTPTPIVTPSLAAFSFTFEPNPAKRGDEVQLHLSSAVDNATAYLNGRALAKKVLANGKTFVVTIPSDATSGFFEIEWSGGRIRASQQLNISQ